MQGIPVRLFQRSAHVLYDLETTGISSLYDEVIEISAVKVRNGKIVDEFSELVNPGRPIPYAASSVNNISDKMVENARSFEKVLPEFLAFASPVRTLSAVFLFSFLT